MANQSRAGQRGVANMERKIKTQQHRLLNAVYRDVANGYAEKGIPMQEIIKSSFDMIPNFEGVRWLSKQFMFKAWGVKSHKDLNNTQINSLIDMWAEKSGRHEIELNLPEQI